MHLIIPMAGLGARFSVEGYKISKPFLRIGTRRMFEIVIANLWSPAVRSLTLVVRGGYQHHIDSDMLGKCLRVPVSIIEIDAVTDGPARTAYLAVENLVGQGSPVIIANSDQYVSYDFSNFASQANEILVMEDDNPKWSYVRLDDSSNVAEVREKEVISNMATVGIYKFSSPEVFLAAFELMEAANDRTNGELYVAPMFNYIAHFGETASILNLGPNGKTFHGLGTPDDYQDFLKSPYAGEAEARANKLFGYETRG